MSNKILLHTLIILIRVCGLLIIWIIGKDAKIKIVIVDYISVSDSLLFHLVIPEGRGRGIGQLSSCHQITSGYKSCSYSHAAPSRRHVYSRTTVV